MKVWNGSVTSDRQDNGNNLCDWRPYGTMNERSVFLSRCRGESRSRPVLRPVSPLELQPVLRSVSRGARRADHLCPKTVRAASPRDGPRPALSISLAAAGRKQPASMERHESRWARVGETRPQDNHVGPHRYGTCPQICQPPYGPMIIQGSRVPGIFINRRSWEPTPSPSGPGYEALPTYGLPRTSLYGAT